MERRQVVLDNIRDNDEAGAHYRQVCECHKMFNGFSLLGTGIRCREYIAPRLPCLPSAVTV